MGEAGRTKRAAAVALIALVCLAAAPAGAGADDVPRGSPVHAAFVKLRSNIRHADGLGSRTRARLPRRAWRAERQRSARHLPGDALRRLDRLPPAIPRAAAPH